MVAVRRGRREWLGQTLAGGVTGPPQPALPFLGIWYAFARPGVVFFLLLVGLAGCSVEHYRQPYDGLEEPVGQVIDFDRPISNLRDEGFVPLPGMRDVYYIPDTGLIVKCDNKFKLNLSLKRTFTCYYLDRSLRKIPRSDFVVQINPFQGDEGFAPYR